MIDNIDNMARIERRDRRVDKIRQEASGQEHQ